MLAHSNAASHPPSVPELCPFQKGALQSEISFSNYPASPQPAIASQCSSREGLFLSAGCGFLLGRWTSLPLDLPACFIWQFERCSSGPYGPLQRPYALVPLECKGCQLIWGQWTSSINKGGLTLRACLIYRSICNFWLSDRVPETPCTCTAVKWDL